MQPLQLLLELGSQLDNNYFVSGQEDNQDFVQVFRLQHSQKVLAAESFPLY